MEYDLADFCLELVKGLGRDAAGLRQCPVTFTASYCGGISGREVAGFLVWFVGDVSLGEGAARQPAVLMRRLSNKFGQSLFIV